MVVMYEEKHGLITSRRMKRRSLRSTAPHAPRTRATSKSRPVLFLRTDITT